MAEVPVDIQIKRLERDRLQIEQNVKGNEIRLYELEVEREQLEDNIKASAPAIADIDKQIAELKRKGGSTDS